MISTDVGVWIAALLTLFALSYPFKESHLYRIVEHTMIGIAAANLVVLAVASVQTIIVQPLTKGNYLAAIPLVLGLLIFGRVSKRYHWVSRWPFAVIVGVGTGLAIRGIISAQVISQVSATAALPLILPNVETSLQNILVVLFVLTSVYYFIMMTPRAHAGRLSIISKIGRWSIMIYLGAKFAASVAFRIALLSGRLQFLLWQWLGLGG